MSETSSYWIFSKVTLLETDNLNQQQLQEVLCDVIDCILHHVKFSKQNIYKQFTLKIMNSTLFHDIATYTKALNSTCSKSACSHYFKLGLNFNLDKDEPLSYIFLICNLKPWNLHFSRAVIPSTEGTLISLKLASFDAQSLKKINK